MPSLHATAAGAASRHCFPKKTSTTIARSDEARVYRVRGQRPKACNLRTGRSVTINATVGFFKPIVVGRFVAWQTFVPVSDTGAVMTSVRVYDTRRRKLVTDTAAFAYSDTNPDYEGEVDPIAAGDLLLEATGAVIWISPTPYGAFEVNEASGRGNAGSASNLARGAGIATGSLAASKAFVYWQQDGQPRFAKR